MPKRSSTSAMSASTRPGSVMSTPDAHRWQVSRHTPTRSGRPIASMHLLDLVQADAHRAARAGRVLDHELRRGRRVGVGEHARERLGHLRHDGVEAAAEMAAEVEDDAVGLDRLGRGIVL